MESREENEAVATLEVRFVDQLETLDVSKEEKLCPKCGREMSLIAAGWYCKRDDHLIDPATNDLVQMIESRRSRKASREGTHPGPPDSG